MHTLRRSPARSTPHALIALSLIATHCGWFTLHSAVIAVRDPAQVAPVEHTARPGVGLFAEGATMTELRRGTRGALLAGADDRPIVDETGTVHTTEHLDDVDAVIRVYGRQAAGPRDQQVRIDTCLRYGMHHRCREAVSLGTRRDNIASVSLASRPHRGSALLLAVVGGVLLALGTSSLLYYLPRADPGSLVVTGVGLPLASWGLWGLLSPTSTSTMPGPTWAEAH